MPAAFQGAAAAIIALPGSSGMRNLQKTMKSSGHQTWQCEIQTKTMGILMGKSSMNDGFSITTFGNQRVHSFTGTLLILMCYSLIASKA